MLPTKQSKRTLHGVMVLMIDMLCFVLFLPIISTLIYKDGSVFALLIFGFIITVPMVLLFGWFIITCIRAYLESDELPHSNYVIFDSVVFGLVFSAVIGLAISIFSIKFSLAMAITGALTGLLIVIFSEPIPKIRSELEPDKQEENS